MVVGFFFGGDGEVGDENEIGRGGFVSVGLCEDGSGAELVRKSDGLFAVAGGTFKGEFEFLSRLAEGRMDGGGAGGLGELQQVVAEFPPR